ncbi:hypothetical protein [Thermostaphylospora chromogena]|uniref:Uncharacterized protein n=1 Tax=Thermostaphylospora chromogena TaxID=35622 RepID=A0A1H1GLY7_9ACTN|nr:hypothetical protein [Thermostaphylospora chromogena]SDR14151.1 hypothetical protein SAMN04489764_3677 [Thermostaphylospora chromogena]
MAVVDEKPLEDEDERALPPAEMMRLIEEQRAVAVRRLGGDPLMLYAPWGLAWLVGFGALFLHYGLSGEPYLPISYWTALTVLFIGMAVAAAVTAYAGWKSATHLRGVSQDRGMMYGLAWPAALIMVAAIALRFGRPENLPPQEIGLLWASLSILVVATLYMAGGALWREWPIFFIGVHLFVLNLVGLVAGPGWHALLTAVGGGGGFIVAGLLMRRRREWTGR